MSQKFLNPVEVNGQVSAEYIDLSTSTSHSVNAGEIAWNSIDGTFDIGLLNGVTLQAGQEMHFYGKATEAISNGNAVMFAGVQGDHILIAKADAVTINANPEYFMGVATQDFSTNDFGYVTAFGNVRGIDTSTYSLGDILYYDSTSATNGLLTPIIPLAPKAKIIVAAVVKVHATQGILAVRPHTMPRLKDIQDINIDTASAGEILQLQSDGVWENKTLSEAGIQPTLTNPVTGTGTTNYVAKFTGTTSLGNSQIFDNGTNVGIGTSSPGSKLTIVSSTNAILKLKGGISNNQGSSFYIERANSTSTLFAIGDSSSITGGTPDSLSTVFSAVPLNFYINGSERVRITSTGNVGIGTTSPTQKLQITQGSSGFPALGTPAAGALLIAGDSNLYGLYVGLDSNSGKSYLQSMRNDSAVAYSMILNPVGGNVGIGTTSPGARLVSLDTSNNISALFGGGATAPSWVAIGTVNSGTVPFIQGYNNTVTGTSNLCLNPNGSANVGIGNTSPTQKLDVTGNIKISNNNSLMFRNAANNADIAIIQLTNTNQLNLGTTSSSVPSVIALHTNSSERMRIDANGNVGIGTTSPASKLHIVGDVYTSTGYIAAGNSYMNSIGNTSTNNNANLSLTTSGVRTSRNIADSNTVFAVINQNASSTGPIQTWNNSGGELMRVAQNGNVGIGNSSPSAKLHVEGSFVSNSPTANFLVDSTNMITASVTSTTHGTGAGFELIDNSAAFGFNPFGDFRGVRADYDNGVWFVNESGGKLGLQPVDNNLWSEGNIIQKAESPLDTINPVAWIKIYNNDDSSFYFMPVYQ